MTIHSAPYFWITCDAPFCTSRSPSGDYEVTAWDGQDQAEFAAVDAEWGFTAGEGWLCPEHPCCETCGDRTVVDTRDPDGDAVCPACALKARQEEVPT